MKWNQVLVDSLAALLALLLEDFLHDLLLLGGGLLCLLLGSFRGLGSCLLLLGGQLASLLGGNDGGPLLLLGGDAGGLGLPGGSLAGDEGGPLDLGLLGGSGLARGGLDLGGGGRLGLGLLGLHFLGNAIGIALLLEFTEFLLKGETLNGFTFGGEPFLDGGAGDELARVLLAAGLDEVENFTHGCEKNER